MVLLAIFIFSSVFFFFIKLGIIIYLDINKEPLIGIQNYFFFLCKGMKTWK